MSLSHRVISGVRRRVLRIRPRDPNPYATHLPVLAALNDLRPIRRVLELGSGPFSTPLFLNTDVFPDLERLISYEDDAEWADVVRGQVGSDPRLDFRVVPNVPDAVPAVAEFDLIFVDDSQQVEQRAKTIRSVASGGPTGVVAIHDFEDPHYRSAARAFEHCAVFGIFTPQVGVCWNGQAVQPDAVEAIRRRIEENRDLDVTDLPSWLAR